MRSVDILALRACKCFKIAEKFWTFHIVRITVWKLLSFSATIFSKKFRESNYYELNWFDEKIRMTIDNTHAY